MTHLTFQDSVRYLYGLGNEVLTMKFGLETIRLLARGLGDVDRRFPSVVIAGTNGKGSVSRFLASAATAAGLKTGLFTSPHLISVRERIRVDGEEISEESFTEHFGRLLSLVRQLKLPCHPTFFECLTALALDYFARREIDLGVLEVGMGGRLDSTNVVEPLLSVITPISLDHQQFLGTTLSQIAREKAGIMRPFVPVLISDQPAEAEAALMSEAARIGALPCRSDAGRSSILEERSGCYSFEFQGQEFRLSSPGRFQVDNARLALEAVEILEGRGLFFERTLLPAGLGSVRVPGVVQVVGRAPLVIVDGGHNPGAAQVLARFLEQHSRPRRALIFGMMRDKEIGRVFREFSPLFEKVYLVALDSPRAATLEELGKEVPRGVPVKDPLQAYREALGWAETVVVAGSFVLAGAFLSRLPQG